MIHKKISSLIGKLDKKKYRKQEGLFVAEGIKIVNELLHAGFQSHLLLATDDTYIHNYPYELISTEDMSKVSSQKTPSGLLGIFHIPSPPSHIDNSKIILALDDINDPGNLGTIIRLSDWFGIKDIICSQQTVDCYNNKVIQSTMGSIARVAVHYLDLEEYLSQTTIPIYATAMNGSELQTTAIQKPCILIMGNEANGIRASILKKSNLITISKAHQGAYPESLNVATATAICLYQISTI